VRELDGSPIRASEIAAVARAGEGVQIASEALDRVARGHRLADEIAEVRPVYGRSTGVGANRDQVVEDPAAAARRLVSSHTTARGAPRSRDRTRALLVVRLQQLLTGGSGIDPAVVSALAGLLDAGAEPTVPDGGGVGTGDLAACAAVAGAVEATGVPLGPGDALALLSSNAGVLGDAALAVTDLAELSRAALVSAALTCVGVGGNAEAFGEGAQAATPLEGARAVAETMRTLIGDRAPARIQDPFALRTLPQVHGPFVDALASTSALVERLVSASSENPVFGPWGVAHHGGFHAAYAAQSLDALVLAAAQAGQLVLARISMLMAPELTGLPAFLADGTPGASGAMLLEYAAASALGDLRALATPASLQSVVLSRGLEEDASFASLAARQALDAVEPLRTLVAAELVCAHRCLTAQPVPLTPILSEATARLSRISTDLADRDLSADLAAAADALPALAALVPA
jgi:histidine ammonia-lyase